MKIFNTLFLSFLVGSITAQVGIGTSSPSVPLDIEAADAAIDINNTSTDPLIHFQVSGTTNFTIGTDVTDSKFKIGTTALETGTAVTVQSTGEVGIGTTTPTNTLEVTGEVLFTTSSALDQFETNVAARSFDFRGNTPGNRVLTVHAGVNAGTSYSDIVVGFFGNDGAASVDGFTMLRNGYIGMGTITPTEVLDIENSDGTKTAIDINNTSTGDPLIHFQLSGTTLHTIGVDDTDSDKLKFGTTAVETGVAMTIDGSQFVGIGTESPVSGLDVQNSMGLKVTAIAGATTLDNTHNIALCSGAAYTVTLPAAASHTGKVYYIKNVDAQGDDITIDGNGSEEIDGATTLVLYVQYDAVRIVSDGTGWHIIADERIPHSCLLKRNTAQSIPNVTATVIDLNSEIIDVGGIGDPTTNNRIDIKRAGNYQITARCLMTTDDAKLLVVRILINGTELAYFTTNSSAAASWITTNGTAYHPLSAGDYIEMSVYHNDGSAVSTQTNSVIQPSLHLIEIR